MYINTQLPLRQTLVTCLEDLITCSPSDATRARVLHAIANLCGDSQMCRAVSQVTSSVTICMYVGRLYMSRDNRVGKG